ncbi:MAG: hypothetical protein IT294_00370 [Deltaproteobacteria bacterium]|nr:hypothetical protein [Deltaproteobacteria bacterium]
MVGLVRPEDIRAFAQRDWRAIADAKRDAWLELRRCHGPATALALADELRRQACLLHPGWPSAQDRAEDLAVHVRVAEALQRVHRAGRQ